MQSAASFKMTNGVPAFDDQVQLFTVLHAYCTYSTAMRLPAWGHLIVHF